jgi:carnitine O-acetyltransferase
MFQTKRLFKRLPIPTLENLESKYLKSLEPLLSKHELEQKKEILLNFKNGIGKELQQRLLALDKEEPNSWLESIWLKKAYLEWREPMLINVNYWCQFKDHPDQNKTFLTHRGLPPKGVMTSKQIERAAGLINNFLNFNDMNNNSALSPDTSRNGELCMEQYKKFFGTTRIPESRCDYLVHQYPTTSKHIIVLARNQMFKVDVLTNENKRVPLLELERLLYDVGSQALRAETLKTESWKNIGILTAGNRDDWAKAYKHLIQLSPRINHFNL